MSIPSIRIGDPVSCGDNSGQGSGNVIFNGIPVTRLGDLTAGHCFSPSPFQDGAATVFVNNKPVVRIGDPIATHCCDDSCHSGVAAVGSPTVFVGDEGVQQVIAAVQVNMQPGINSPQFAETVDCDPGADQVYKNYNTYIDILQPPTGTQTVEEEAPPPAPPPADVPNDCVDIESHTGPFPGSFQLSPNFTLAQLSTNTLVSNYSVRAQVGLTEKQIVCNLRALCINVLEPLKAKYGTSMRINSAFRHGSGSSQHYRGMAVDVSFTDTPSTDSSFARANEIKDECIYDQYIYEQNRSLWHHLSYNSVSNRRQVLSKPRGNKFLPGLVKIVVS